MIREDYIIRLVKQLAEFVGKIAGYRHRGDYQGALAAIDSAWDQMFDVPRELREVVDTATLAQLLGQPAVMRAAGQLLVEEGRALEASGDPPGAAMRYRRALELHLEARALEPADTDDAVILELSRSVPAADLDPRYRPG